MPAAQHWFQVTERTDTEVICAFTDGFGVERVMTLLQKGLNTCTCVSPTRPCVHLRLASNYLSTHSDHFTPAEQDTATVPVDAQKSQRQAERVQKLELAMQDLQLWVEDQFSRGFATQIQEQAEFAERIALRMADASLGTLHRRLIALQEKTLHQLRTNQPIPLEWADLLFLLKAGKSQQQLPDALWSELCQSLGISVRKEDVKAQGKKIRDQFTVAGVQKQQLDARLLERTIWVYAHEKQRFYAYIEHEVAGITHLAAAPRRGFTFDSEAWLYPTAAEVRILFDEIPEPRKHDFVDIPVLANLSAAYQNFIEATKSVPWISATAVMIEKTLVYHDPKSKKWLLRDADGFQISLRNATNAQAAQLVAHCLHGPCTVFGLLNAEGIEVI
jgi:hypothetical protein